MKLNNKSKKADKVEKPKKAPKTVAVLGEYNGSVMIRIMKEGEEDDADAYSVFQCGLAKAKAIVRHFDAFKAFVESEGESVD